MNKSISFFLLAFFTFIGLCPTVMVNASNPTCHQTMQMDMSGNIENNKDKTECIHEEIIQNTIIPSVIDIGSGEFEPYNSIIFLETVPREYFSLWVQFKINPNTLAIPPPNNWLTQKQIIILRI